MVAAFGAMSKSEAGVAVEQGACVAANVGVDRDSRVGVGANVGGDGGGVSAGSTAVVED